MLWECAVMTKYWSRFLAAADNLWVVQRIFGMVGFGGRWSEALLSLNAFWQVKFQECVNDSYAAWSSFPSVYSTH